MMDVDEEPVDDALRLRTVMTAASTIAESIRSEQRMEQRRTKRRRLWGTNKSKKPRSDIERESIVTESQASTPSTTSTRPRRRIYFNAPLNQQDVDSHGVPTARYVRNKVKTSKYTPLTFIPKNLYEQFRRVANLYFLLLVCIQVFPIFGAAAPQIAMLPLVFILTVTAIKDGVEDYRRATLDDQVNNSATTKLGEWRNVNIPADPRSWFERFFGLNAPGSVSKGVRKIRDREALEGRIILPREEKPATLGSSTEVDHSVKRMTSLDDIASVHSADIHEYPPIPSDLLAAGSTASLSIGANSSNTVLINNSSQTFSDSKYRAESLNSNYPLSTRTGVTSGVVDWSRRPASGGTAKWERTLWKKLEVGDVVLLREDDQIPADIAVLATSDPDGICYVETKNLDGETNLKPRKGLNATAGISGEEDLDHARFVVDSEPPHANLYLYNGVLRYEVREGGGTSEAGGQYVQKTEPVTINQILLRGCTVRNTNWIIGLVVFTGADTKIMLNGGETPSKRSKIEKETNFNVIMNFLILLVMCITTAIVSGYFETLDNTSADWYEIKSNPTDSVILNSLITFASCLIAFQNIVPISLYISIEIVKTIQAYFIAQDVDMYYAPYASACAPKTWNISDDLGQIEYIFSDKTGTLTQNIMEFQKCSINGVIYGEGITEAMRGAAKREGRENDMLNEEDQQAHLSEQKEDMVQRMQRNWKNRYLQEDKLTLISPALSEHLSDRAHPQRGHLIAFFRALAVCHTVLADTPSGPLGAVGTENTILDYKAESPDEAALVGAARDVGFPFLRASNSSIDIEALGQPERYIPLRVLEFNSTRKRMSVICRTPDGRIILYTKGADSVIYARLAADHDAALKDQTARDMETFANGGLRTLAIAYRYISEEEYLTWSRIHDTASSSVKNRDEEMEKAAELMEKDLRLLGATALEDKLQEGVPAAIELLHQAGIKLWILTGDKLQTAIEIGFSCNLLKNDMEIMILAADSADDARAKIEAGLNKVASIVGPPGGKFKRNQDDAPSPQGLFAWFHSKLLSDRANAKPKGSAKAMGGGHGGFAVVIDGDTLRYALEPSLKPLFLSLGTQCDTVVCCRVSPAQKALTVKLVKDGCNAMTLSIGDGANDVAMIQEANIGCGLLGLEGSQAAMSADYAFGQFRFLTKLLLVHGRWSYIRIADMHSNFFYKNVIWTFAMFWFLFYNSFDATYLYEYTFILLYNLIFTSLPVIVMGAFDQDINAKASLAFPQLYTRGIYGLEYTRTKFWLYMLDGFYQSVIVFFIPFLSFSGGASLSWSGKTLDSLADLGTTVAIAAIFSANLFVGMNTRYWTVITWIAVVGSMLVMCIWVTIYSFFDSIAFNREVVVLFSTVGFWTTVIITIILAIGPRFVLKYVAQAYFPMDKDIVRESWVVGDLKDRLGIEHRRTRKNKGSGQTVEDISLFRPHLRSVSDMSSDDQERGYEPVVPKTRGNELHVPGPHARAGTEMSYYSASEIPYGAAPSPVPSPKMRSLSPRTAEQQHSNRPGSRTTHQTPPASPLSLAPPRSPTHPQTPTQSGEYEMSLRRSTLHSPDVSSHSRASNSSFVTASDGGWEDDDDGATVRQHGRSRESYYPQTGQAL